jgi:hypothetical protein
LSRVRRIGLLVAGGALEEREEGGGERRLENRQRRSHQPEVGAVAIAVFSRSGRLAHPGIVRRDPFNRVANPMPTTLSYRPRPHLDAGST